MRKLFSAVCVASSILLSFTSHAALVATDWKTAGDGYATLDQVTGIEWLDLDFTFGMTFAEVQSELSLGGALYGWRFATGSEVFDFTMGEGGFIASDYQGDKPAGSTYLQNDNMAEYLSLLTNSGSAYGLVARSDGQLLLSGVREDLAKAWNRLGPYTLNYANAGVGFYLVSDGGVTLSSTQDPTLNINNPDAPVNQVPVMTFSGVLLLGLGLSRRRKS